MGSPSSKKNFGTQRSEELGGDTSSGFGRFTWIGPVLLLALLSPDDSTYQSNSSFVWHLLRDAGFELPYVDTIDLPTAYGLRLERTANIGDLALYYSGGVPYHVAMVESDDGIVSATLNAGLRRSPFGAFAGEIRYLRPVSDADLPPTQTPTQPTRKPTEKPRR